MPVLDDGNERENIKNIEIFAKNTQNRPVRVNWLSQSEKLASPNPDISHSE